MPQGEHSAILSTLIKFPFVIKIFVLSTFEWPFDTSFSVHNGVKIALFFLAYSAKLYMAVKGLKKDSDYLKICSNLDRRYYSVRPN